MHSYASHAVMTQCLYAMHVVKAAQICRYGMLDPGNKDSNDLPLTIRAVFIVGPDKKLKLSLNYPASVGRNMDEIVRCIDALQLSAKHSIVSSHPNVCFAGHAF